MPVVTETSPNRPIKQPPMVPLPTIAFAGYVLSPLLLVVGGFLAWVNADKNYHWIITQTLIGKALFLIGALWFTTSVILTGVRRIVDSYARILQQGQRP